MTLDMMVVDPFPIEMVSFHTMTLAAQITLLEELPAGTTVSVALVKEGIINLPIPCLSMGGVMVGSW